MIRRCQIFGEMNNFIPMVLHSDDGWFISVSTADDPVLRKVTGRAIMANVHNFCLF